MHNASIHNTYKTLTHCYFYQLKTPKEKEDFAKKLTELHQAPSMEELADLAGASTASSLKHKRIEERHQLWKELDSKSRHEETSGSRDTKMVHFNMPPLTFFFSLFH